MPTAIQIAMEARDRWFHGIHAHSVPVPGASPPDGITPGSSSRVVALATPDDLVKLDLYGTLAEKHVGLTRRQLRLMYRDVPERTERVFAGLTPTQLRATCDPSLNPMDWGLGHIAHFYEFMILRLLAPGSKPVLPGHDVHALFDSFRANHDDRWKPSEVCGTDPSIGEIRGYIADVTERLVDAVGPDDDTRLDPVSTYLHVYGIVHEHWHVEDFIQTRHTLGYPPPARVPDSPKTYAADCAGAFLLLWRGRQPRKPSPRGRTYSAPRGTSRGCLTPSGGRTRSKCQRFESQRPRLQTQSTRRSLPRVGTISVSCGRTRGGGGCAGTGRRRRAPG